MRFIVSTNIIPATPEFYLAHPGVIVGCFGGHRVWYYVREWEWTDDRAKATVLDRYDIEVVLVNARTRYATIENRDRVEIKYEVVEQ